MTLRSAGGRWIRSAHTRFIALLVLIELLLGGAILAVTVRQLQSDINARDLARLAQLRDDLVGISEEGGTAMMARAINARAAEFELRDDVVLLVDGQGRVLAGNLTRWPSALPAPATIRVMTLRRAREDSARPFLIMAQKLDDDSRLLVGRAMEGSDALRESISSALFTALGVSLPLALAGAWAAMMVIDSHIDRINRTAARVASGQIGARVLLDGSGDRFDRLAINVNAMLERIEGLVAELRSLSDALAHDLRSPITRLRSRIERARHESDGESVPAETLVAIGREADLLLGILNNVLAISRAEAGLGQEHMEKLDLAALVEDMAELYAPLAEEQGRTVTAQILSPGLVTGQRDLLGQALANLIDNALMHGAGDIVLRLDRVGENVRLAVCDEGAGLAPEDEARALSRFGRLDAARSMPGAGLGLSLVAALVRLHGGTLGFERAPGQFAVFFTLPGRLD